MSDPLQPPMSLLCKLGSIAVHAEEMVSPTGHAFDKQAMETLLKDSEVSDWLTRMDKLAMLPKKRTIEDVRLHAKTTRTKKH